MNKELYTPTELEIITFQTADVITTSGGIEEMPTENGGGVLVDP